MCLSAQISCKDSGLKAAMNTLENSSDAQSDALYTSGPALKLQRNWSREKQFKPKPNTDSKKSDGLLAV